MTEKYNKYQLAFKPPADVSDNIKDLVKQHGTENPISRGWLHLKTEKGALSEKQRDEILYKGKMDIRLKFSCKGVFKMGEKSYLTFRILGMKKLDDQPVVLISDDF